MNTAEHGPSHMPRGVPTLAVIGGALVAFPVVALVLSFVTTDAAGAIAQLASPPVRRALWLSLWISTAAATAALILGLPIAWVLARLHFRGKAILRAALLLPLVIPPVVSGLALLSAWSQRSFVGRRLEDWFGWQLTYSAAGAVVAATFVSLPLFVVAAESALAGVNRHYEDIAASLGARPWRVAREITLPLARPGLLAGLALTWARALGEFGATLTFAGNVEGRTQTAPLAIYLALDTDRPVAYALSVSLMAIAIGVLVALRGYWLPVRRDSTDLGRA